MTLAWPWSVPRLPFSCTVRPNSDIVTSVDVALRDPRSLANAAMARPQVAQAVRELSLRRPLAGVRVPAARRR